MAGREYNLTKNYDSKRPLAFKIKDGTKPLDGSGMVDSRLFSGGNTMFAEMDKQTTLWTVRYEHGAVPIPLQQQFTSFTRLLGYVRDYFARRNVEVTDGSTTSAAE